MSYAFDNKNYDSFNFSKTDEYFGKLCLNSHAFNSAIINHGNSNIAEFLKKIKPLNNNNFQQFDALNNIIYDYVSKLLGKDIASDAVETIANERIVLTANHQGVDFFAQSVQGSMLFSLIFKENLSRNKVVPIIACGNISLNNLTYPRGILIYDLKTKDFNKIPLKLPIFPDREKTKTVCAVNAIKKEYVINVLKKVFSLKKDGIISNACCEVLINLLEQEYLDDFILQQKNYSDQAVILNFRLWKRIFKSGFDNFKIVYLELEEIAAKLIERDLCNQNSLLYITLFDPIVRNRLINGLDRKKACWENNLLKERCLNEKSLTSEAKNYGTHFFWGIDNNKKRIPFFLDECEKDNPSLTGFAENGRSLKIPFRPEILREKLLLKEIIPSLFLSYSALSFARGITCVGGYYQSEYLPIMKSMLIESLSSQTCYNDLASSILNVETNNYLSGMQTIMIMRDNNSIVPAGLIELIATGGINENDFHKVLKINVFDAHKASMLDTLTDLKIDYSRDECWKEIISKQNYIDLKENLIIRKIV